MVFFKKQLVKALRVPPKSLGPTIRQTVRDLLVADVEGTCIDGAFVVAVVSIDKFGDGYIEPLEGYVRFDITYNAIMMKPFKNEILDSTVSQVTAVRGGVGGGG